ncbi:hypothetical protein V8E36_005970 [Tilletia maclaganii]
MITPSETQTPLALFLSWLLALVPAPHDIVIDCSITEMAAIKTAYAAQPRCPRVLLCQWHVLRAWEDNIRTKVRLSGVDDESDEIGRATQKIGRELLRQLAYADTETSFEEQLSTLRATFAQQFPVFVAYFEREWIVKRPPLLWAKAYRPHAHLAIDTNNYIESWHGSLKLNYLGLVRKQRVDHVLFVLAREVVPDYVRRLVQCKLGGILSEPPAQSALTGHCCGGHAGDATVDTLYFPRHFAA